MWYQAFGEFFQKIVQFNLQIKKFPSFCQKMTKIEDYSYPYQRKLQHLLLSQLRVYIYIYIITNSRPVLAKIIIFPNIVCKHHILNSWSKVIRLNGIRKWKPVWENFAKFRPEKYDLNLYNGFSMGKWPKFDRFQKEKNPSSPAFYRKFK